MIESIDNHGEFFSDHYMSALLAKDLGDVRSRWSEDEGRGENTARTLLRGIRSDFFSARGAAREEASPNGALTRLADVVARGLNYPADAPEELVLTRAEREEVRTTPLAVLEGASGLVAVVLEAGFAEEAEQIFDPDAAGRLRHPITVEGEPKPVETASAAASLIFRTDDPPRYVVIVAGPTVLLAERTTWSEGRWLSVDLDAALERNDQKARGELETIAALFSADALVPHEGTAVLDQLAEKSLQHAVGVSEDLRDGLRRSVEILANEVIALRKERKLKALPAGDAADLTRQCLRYLYRLVVLLYAEARPELGVLPSGDSHYDAGYGLERLRDLCLTELSETAGTGTHLHESLSTLFGLVNRGHGANAQRTMVEDVESGEVADDSLFIPPLTSRLFSRDAAPLLDDMKLRNDALQQVLRNLMLSRESAKLDRGFVSYAQLGINQLGAVYEGLMAYSGLFADGDYFEVAKNGDPSDGVWLLPVGDADEYPDDVFVTDKDDQRVLHTHGTFIYRLSGRDRQRSASYYTPEVLTRCVVKHTLEVLFEERPELTARDLLDLTICEPALGSGAFLNEMINQLADQYLSRRQAERVANGDEDATIDPEDYERERQMVKAHLALHQCYGVDLNSTAVELAEVSLWLNSMHKGFGAPWFGLQLRRGNSLVGARRAVYSTELLAKSTYLTTPPEDRPLVDVPIGDDEIHHFLLPAKGWGAAGSAKQAKEIAPDEAKALREWSKKIGKAPSAKDADRLMALSARVEELWALAGEQMRLAQEARRTRIDVWGAEPTGTRNPPTRDEIQRRLDDPNGPRARLRLVMDAWVALWSWPFDVKPPSWAQWLSMLEAVLGTRAGAPMGQLAFEDLDALQAQMELSLPAGMASADEVLAAHPWLATANEIVARDGALHWELEFAPVFSSGGFDLQVGNPPWVRLDWEEDAILADYNPVFGTQDRPSASAREERRRKALLRAKTKQALLVEAASFSGLTAIVGDHLLREALRGIRTNLYMVFLDQAWRNSSPIGVVGLLHPESHFTDPRAARLRAAAYVRLRRHFQFRNELKLFAEISNTATADFGINVYARQRDEPCFLSAASLLEPNMAANSLSHDGHGEVPGVQYPAGGWDLRPHAKRIITVDLTVLADWAQLFDAPGTEPEEARLLRPVTQDDLEGLAVLAAQPARIADQSYSWTQGFNETTAAKNGTIEWSTRIPSSWDEVLLQGPHFTVSTPFAKQPNENCKNNRDYSAWNLEALPPDAIPRTNYQRACEREAYDASLDTWRGRSSADYWRVAWRSMTEPGLERSLHVALLAPAPSHVGSANSLSLETDRQTVLASALWSSLVMDSLVKVSGAANVKEFIVRRFPHPAATPLLDPLSARSLRLNCLASIYGPLWEAQYNETWLLDSWVLPGATVGLNDVAAQWTSRTPLRRDLDRRLALVEIDALAAIALGLSADHLCAIYRSQFPVLRKYEHSTYFDAEGRRYAKEPHARGVLQKKGDYEAIEAWHEDDSTSLPDHITPPFTKPDREAEMRIAHAEFTRRLEEGVYS